MKSKKISDTLAYKRPLEDFAPLSKAELAEIPALLGMAQSSPCFRCAFNFSVRYREFELRK